MKEVIGNYEVELSGSLVMIRKDNELIGSKEVNPNDVVSGYNQIVNVVKSKVQ